MTLASSPSETNWSYSNEILEIGNVNSCLAGTLGKPWVSIGFTADKDATQCTINNEEKAT